MAYNPVIPDLAVSFEDAVSLYVHFSRKLAQTIPDARYFAKEHMYLAYCNAQKNYKECLMMLTLPMFQTLTTVEEVSVEFPEWRDPEEDDVPFFSNDWEDIPYKATGTNSEVPF